MPEQQQQEQKHPWERQEGEPNKWFDRFERYLLAGPNRTVLACYNEEAGATARERGSKTWKAKPAPPGSWSISAERWRWRERAEAFDERERLQARERYDRKLRERREAWAVQAQALQAKAAERLLALDAEELSVRDVLAYLNEGVRLELLAYGEAQAISEERTKDLGAAPPGPAQMSDGDLRRELLEYRQRDQQRQQQQSAQESDPPGDAAPEPGS